MHACDFSFISANRRMCAGVESLKKQKQVENEELDQSIVIH